MSDRNHKLPIEYDCSECGYEGPLDGPRHPGGGWPRRNHALDLSCVSSRDDWADARIAEEGGKGREGVQEMKGFGGKTSAFAETQYLYGNGKPTKRKWELQRRISLGLCVTCGKRSAREGKKTCQECMCYSAAYKRQSRMPGYEGPKQKSKRLKREACEARRKIEAMQEENVDDEGMG